MGRRRGWQPRGAWPGVARARPRSLSPRSRSSRPRRRWRHDPRRTSPDSTRARPRAAALTAVRLRSIRVAANPPILGLAARALARASSSRRRAASRSMPAGSPVPGATVRPGRLEGAKPIVRPGARPTAGRRRSMLSPAAAPREPTRLPPSRAADRPHSAGPEGHAGEIGNSGGLSPEVVSSARR